MNLLRQAVLATFGFSMLWAPAAFAQSGANGNSQTWLGMTCAKYTQSEPDDQANIIDQINQVGVGVADKSTQAGVKATITTTQLNSACQSSPDAKLQDVISKIRNGGK